MRTRQPRIAENKSQWPPLTYHKVPPAYSSFLYLFPSLAILFLSSHSLSIDRRPDSTASPKAFPSPTSVWLWILRRAELGSFLVHTHTNPPPPTRSFASYLSDASTSIGALTPPSPTPLIARHIFALIAPNPPLFPSSQHL